MKQRSFWRRRLLEPAMDHGGVTFVVTMALLLSTMFMSITGGAPTSYERRTLASAFAGYVLGDADARERLAAGETAPYFPRRARSAPIEPVALPGSPVDADAALLGADLLGGPQRSPPILAETAPAMAEPALDGVGT